jgi:DNA-binding transcriptional ArsR family regulator
VSETEEIPVDSLAEYLKALGHPRRLQALRFLTRPHHLEEIASHLGVARQTAQEHVQQLLDLGFIQSVPGRGQHGAVRDYVLAPQRLFAVHEMLGRLGDLQAELEEDVEMRLATVAADAPQAKAPVEGELPRLTIVHGMRVGQTSVLSGSGPWLVGRDPHALVCLDYDPFVSTRHAELRRVPAGGFELADLYSSNGTYLDWKRLDRGAVRKLDNGGLVRCGKTLLLFRKGA